MKVDWKGVYPAISTQFDANGQLDLAANERMLNQLIDEGIHGIIALGTVGENCSLSADEKRTFLRHTVSVAKGRIPVIAGCAETTTAFAIDYCRDAEAIGVDGIMLLPGMVYRANREETLYHYRTVARATGLPIMIYNNPVTYGVDVDLEMTAELAEEANIVAIKESTTDTRRITELHNQFGDRFTIFCGVDDIALESLMLGATGWISGLTNVFPKESVAIYNLAQQGRYAEALELWRWFLPLLRLDTVPHLVQCIKFAEQLAGRGSETVRAPRLPLSGAERERVTRVYDEAITARPDLGRFNLD
ncbi:dihydrodipicolinate synthase family protein [Ferrimonas balearica]|uniref:dihydrodipicolinate synthase family protein n=1 Tax=Ferrimonas balearica TaxID=44012 RepID=UPI001F35E5ED|nr:dihydrodipicolinate synthase family protein [Ferrimonas balearica]MBY6019710.1 dihydrodipicolinate synthase family protein [Halomonas denitrificans]MBY6096776.1 dihydrodipicolinate synthase family protein [Ferrimonas balearica]